MNFGQFKQSLSACCSTNVRFRFEGGGEIEAHCHVTEIGKVTKDFVDCGGVRRKTETCVLQTYVANDVDHRVKVDTLGKIIGAAGPLGLNDDFDMEVEYQSTTDAGATIGLYSVKAVEPGDGELVFVLESKATACLAPDSCGIDASQMNAGSIQLTDANTPAAPSPGGC